MIKVISRSFIKPNTLKKTLTLYKTLVEKTRAESGCISYELFQNIHNENNLTLIEEWCDLASLQRHTETPHFIEIVAKLAKYETELPVEIYSRVY